MRFARYAVLAFACSCGTKSTKDVVPDATALPSDLATMADMWSGYPVDLSRSDLSIVTSGPNVAPIIIDDGPAGNSYNELFISITLCAPGSSTNCQTIDHVQVDTGSVGLRVLSSVLEPALLSALPQAQAGGNALTECYAYNAGTTYGSVRTADLTIAQEKASSLLLEVIADPTYSAGAPASCTSFGSVVAAPVDLAANAVIGVGTFPFDCGELCAGAEGQFNPLYYTCATPSTCTAVGVPPAQQVGNPVSLFATDNNGVLIELPAISDQGQINPTGALLFGIGTQDNNKVMGETVYAAPYELSDAGAPVSILTTEFEGRKYIDGIFDCGAPYTTFATTAVPSCTGSAAALYCPTTTQYLTATITAGSVSGTVHFTVANAVTVLGLDQADTAFDDVAANNSGGDLSYFDWGLTFFFGRRVFSAIEGATTPYGTGPYYAF